MKNFIPTNIKTDEKDQCLQRYKPQKLIKGETDKLNKALSIKILIQ